MFSSSDLGVVNIYFPSILKMIPLSLIYWLFPLPQASVLEFFRAHFQVLLFYYPLSLGKPIYMCLQCLHFQTPSHTSLLNLLHIYSFSNCKPTSCHARCLHPTHTPASSCHHPETSRSCQKSMRHP